MNLFGGGFLIKKAVSKKYRIYKLKLIWKYRHSYIIVYIF